jgi:hypothetical protein
MKIKYSFSTWNNLVTRRPYLDKPIQKDLNKIKEVKKIVKNDYVMFYDETINNAIVYLKKTVNNGFSQNKYIDVYSVI